MCTHLNFSKANGCQVLTSLHQKARIWRQVWNQKRGFPLCVSFKRVTDAFLQMKFCPCVEYLGTGEVQPWYDQISDVTNQSQYDFLKNNNKIFIQSYSNLKTGLHFNNYWRWPSTLQVFRALVNALKISHTRENLTESC